MQIRVLKYLIPFIFFIGALRSFQSTGLIVWIPMLIAWLLIPLLELLIKPDPANMNAAEEEIAKKNSTYDFILYLVGVFQYVALYFFLQSMKTDTLT